MGAFNATSLSPKMPSMCARFSLQNDRIIIIIVCPTSFGKEIRKKSQYFPKDKNSWKFVHTLPKKSKSHSDIVWKSSKKSHSTLQVKRATFTFWVAKSSLKMPKLVHFCDLKLAVKLIIEQKLMENTKIERLKWDILGDFQTLCIVYKTYASRWIGAPSSWK